MHFSTNIENLSHRDLAVPDPGDLADEEEDDSLEAEDDSLEAKVDELKDKLGAAESKLDALLDAILKCRNLKGLKDMVSDVPNSRKRMRAEPTASDEGPGHSKTQEHSKRQKVEHPFRLHFLWRGREKGEGVIQLDPEREHRGYLDFDTKEASTFHGVFQGSFLGQDVSFSGNKISEQSGQPNTGMGREWEDYSEQAYERERSCVIWNIRLTNDRIRTYLYRAHVHGHPFPRVINRGPGRPFRDSFASDEHLSLEQDAEFDLLVDDPVESTTVEDVFGYLRHHLNKTQADTDELSPLVSLSEDFRWTAQRYCNRARLATNRARFTGFDHVPGLAIFDTEAVRIGGQHLWRVQDMFDFMDSSTTPFPTIPAELRRWARNAEDYVCWHLVPHEALVVFLSLEAVCAVDPRDDLFFRSEFITSKYLGDFHRCTWKYVSMKEYSARVRDFMCSVLRCVEFAYKGRLHVGSVMAWFDSYTEWRYYVTDAGAISESLESLKQTLRNWNAFENIVKAANGLRRSLERWTEELPSDLAGACVEFLQASHAFSESCRYSYEVVMLLEAIDPESFVTTMDGLCSMLSDFLTPRHRGRCRGLIQSISAIDRHRQRLASPRFDKRSVSSMARYGAVLSDLLELNSVKARIEQETTRCTGLKSPSEESGPEYLDLNKLSLT
ncbi:hypothetical protein F5Y15DRAFT_415497 [Xylariaceae sp. FL0016]|nr:hypothetical protein F5Y15DRAFT_415497 [Xylariaceae sp. FL0016]